MDEEVLQVAPDHHANHRVALDLLALKAANIAPVAQDYGAVSDLFHFIQPMRNVDDAHAVRFQVFNCLKKPSRLRKRETGGRLVHDEDACACADAAGDFDKLLLSDGEFA